MKVTKYRCEVQVIIMNKLVLDKQEWWINYICKNKVVDMLNQPFVDAYIKEFNPKHVVMPWGANKCKELSVLLSDLYSQGILKRSTVGIPYSTAGLGFPKWIYCYELTDLGHKMLD